MKEPTIIIAGANGFVGTRAMDYYKNAIPVPSNLLRNAGEPLMDFIKKHNPDIILNTAAISDIGTCEKNPDDSYTANVILPVVLAKVARETSAKFISFSSDQVYTGCMDDGPYREEDRLPKPANVYACHKLEAEQRVLDIDSDAIMLRATWMYDMPMYGGFAHANRGNFFVNTLNSAMYGKKMSYSSEQYRGITYVRQVVSLLDKVFALSGGVYNYGSENNFNMFETANALLRELKLEERVQIEDSKQKRHNLWMDCSKIAKQDICFDTTVEGFKRCVNDYGLKY